MGEGSDIKITVHNKSGSKLDVISGKVNRNCFKTTHTVSDKAKEGIYFEAELPKHRLKKKSEVIKILPSRSITNARWLEEKQDVVKKEVWRGEIVRLSADVSGFVDGTEAKFEIYEYDQDEAHDFITKLSGKVKGKKVETLWEYEYHEDTDEIPTQEEMEKVGGKYSPPEYFFKVIIGGKEAKSELLEFRDWIEIELKDEAGEPVGNEDYVLHLADGQRKEGKLDENGYAKVEDIPPGKIDIEFPNVHGVELTE